MFFAAFLIVQRPLITILQYPNRMLHHRTDRIAGQKVYNRFYLDLRNSVNAKVWTRVTSTGDKLVLIVSLLGYDNLESEGKKVYRLWRYSPEKDTLWRQEWDTAQLSGALLPAVSDSPTNSEWTEFEKAVLKHEAYHVQSFDFSYAMDVGSRLEYTIKNPRRDGKVDSYLLEVEAL